MPTTHLGRAFDVEVVEGEEGFELHIELLDGAEYAVNVHGVSAILLKEVMDKIGAYYQEALAAAASRPVTDDADAYPADDPKHPNWHSVHADLYPKEA